MLNHKLIAIIVSSYRQLIPCLDKKLPHLLLSIVGYSRRLCREILNEELKHDVIMVVTSTILAKRNYSIIREALFILSLCWKVTSVSKAMLIISNENWGLIAISTLVSTMLSNYFVH